MATVFVQGSSGAINLMDVPTDPHGLERYNNAIQSGALTVIDPDRVIEEPHPRWPEYTVYRLAARTAAPEPRVGHADTPVDFTAVDPGEPADVLAESSKQELFDMAESLGIETKASWNKADLIDAIRAAGDAGVQD